MEKYCKSTPRQVWTLIYSLHLLEPTKRTEEIRRCNLALRKGFNGWLIGTSCALLLLAGLFGCSSKGTLGMITKDSANVSNLLHLGQAYEEHGLAKGSACHYHVLLIPFGRSDISVALDDALAESHSDALIGVTTGKWYAGLPLPLIRSLFDVSCTTVTGTAVKFQNVASRAVQ